VREPFTWEHDAGRSKLCAKNAGRGAQECDTGRSMTRGETELLAKSCQTNNEITVDVDTLDVQRIGLNDL
jgi:hypothetical protein